MRLAGLDPEHTKLERFLVVVVKCETVRRFGRLSRKIDALLHLHPIMDVVAQVGEPLVELVLLERPGLSIKQGYDLTEQLSGNIAFRHQATSIITFQYR